MKDRLRALIAPDADEHAGRWTAREYLQHYVLYLLFRTKHYRRMAFTGGTALRALHGLPRFSEDLDFSLVDPEGQFDFSALRADLLSGLSQAGYAAKDRPKETGAVVNTFLKFPGLLHELGLSAQPREVLSVKVEIDTNPPAGAATELVLVNKHHMMYQTLSHDLPSMFAGKLHALLFRRFTKGRDLYDLLWFLTAHSELAPNLSLLNNAAAQTEAAPPKFDAANWREHLLRRLGGTDVEKAREEIRPFLERPEEADFIELDNFARLLARS